MKEFSFGVIGVGYLGRFHADKYAAIPGIRFAGISDIDAARLQEVSAALGVKAYPDYRELLINLDAVSIAVPTQRHFEIAKQALMAGVDILVEKPMTVNSREAGALNRMAARKKKIIQVGHLERFNPAMARVSGEIKKPGFIEAHRLAQFVERGTDVDVVLDLMIHDIDLVLSMVKSRLKSVHSVGVPVITRRVDIANARLEFANGCVANLTASRVSRDAMRKIRVFHESGYFSIDLQKRQVMSVKREGPLGEGELNISAEAFECDQGDALMDEIKSFVASVKSRRKPVVSGEDGQEALRVAEKIISGMRKRR